MELGQKYLVIEEFEAHIGDTEDIITIPKGSTLTKIENGKDYYITYAERFDFNGQIIEFSTYDVEDVLEKKLPIGMELLIEDIEGLQMKLSDCLNTLKTGKELDETQSSFLRSINIG